MNDIKLFYITDFSKEKERLLDLYKKYYGADALQRYNERIPWYQKNEDYHLLVAEANGELVGQACVYKANVIAYKKMLNFHWSIDTFILSQMRGRGLGKKLQAKLHEDFSNFSSAWYSATNGIIKKKCGARELFLVNFAYYPVSKYHSFIIDRAIRKLFKKEIHFSLPIYQCYNFYKGKGLDGVELKEVSFTDEIIAKIHHFLESSDYDFYFERTKEFFIWKYDENPNLKYHLFEVKKNGKAAAIFAVSHVFETIVKDGKANVCTILDHFIDKESDISLKELIALTIDYYKGKSKLEGIKVIGSVDLPHGQITSMPLLTTYNGEIPNHPYLSFIDQDMEQMI